MFIREEQDACREGQGSYKTRYGSAQMRGTREVDVICLTPSVRRNSSIRALVSLSHAVRLDPHLSVVVVVDVAWWSHTVLAFMFLARTSHTSFISIFPPVCRNIAKQTFLETLQDNLIEMDILASARHDASYNDGYVACLLSGSHPTVRICFAMKTIVMPALFFFPIKHPLFWNVDIHFSLSPAVLESLLYLSLPCLIQLTICT